MKAKLVKKYERVNIYELSELIHIGKSDIVGIVNIEKSLKDLYPD